MVEATTALMWYTITRVRMKLDVKKKLWFKYNYKQPRHSASSLNIVDSDSGVSGINI